MTRRTTRDRLPQPPGICVECFTNQRFNPADQGGDAFYCDHNQCLALPKSDFSGWIVESGIDRAEWQRRVEGAAVSVGLLAAAAKKMN